MGLVAWLVLGAIAGYLAGMFVKGDERLGVIGHVFLGIVGALVGGFIANQLTNGDYLNRLDITSIIVAVIGAIVVVVAYKALTGRRQI
ncbi:MAG: GlsB/YeaQ/YmgE family stress response membrane protein [Chloroflexota bacterium]